MKKKHSLKARVRAFAIWQKLGYNPWKRPRQRRTRTNSDFYKGAFDTIPFLNDDAKRTFSHLLLRPGYMIRDYIRGDHERYLAPLTALIVFYAFFALVWSVMQPVQHKDEDIFTDPLQITVDLDGKEGISRREGLIHNTVQIVQKGYLYLTLDQHPEAVHSRRESALAALERTMRSQGIPLFLGNFFLLWFAMSVSLRRYKTGMSATAAATAYALCQFSFFMLFAVLLTWGRSKSIGLSVILIMLTVDLHQWLDIGWKKSIRLAIRTAIWYGLFFLLVLLVVSAIVFLVALTK